jgi:Uma2 family endonuclease
MIAETANHFALVSQLPEDTVVTFHNVSWDEYEELLAQVGEASGLRVSFNDGAMKIMTLSDEHEKNVELIKSLVGCVRLRLHVDILSFGSATMRKRKKAKGSEPDASFYIQNAAVIGNRIQRDLAVDPPPDLVVEVDIHHDSRDSYPIYAALGVPEVWRLTAGAMNLSPARAAYAIVDASVALRC